MKQLTILLTLLLGAAGGLQAVPKSIAFANGSSTMGSVTPAGSPYTSLPNTTLTGRFHGFAANPGGSYHYICAISGLSLRWHVIADQISVETADTLSTNLVIDVAGRTDIWWRVIRNTSSSVESLEIWDADGSNYDSISATIVNPGSGNYAALMIVGDGFSKNYAIEIASFQWYSTAHTVADSVPYQQTGDLGNWNFESNTNDDSGHGLNLSMSGSPAATYTNTPVLPPSCSAGSVSSQKTGIRFSLDGTGSYSFDGGSLTYLWRQVSGPAPITLSSATSSTPSVTGHSKFGSYVFGLTVTDGSQSTSCTIKKGAVNVDANDIVQLPRGVELIITNPVRWGASSWPWMDQIFKSQADYFGGLQSTTYNATTTWNAAVTGTVVVTNGSAAVVGTGTDFQNTFCGGGTTGDGSYFISWYDAGGGVRGRDMYYVSSCTDPTHITLSAAYRLPTESGIRFSKMTSAQVGLWLGQSSNVNYYDNVMAFYTLYYRTGLDDYLTYARQLADWWWINPYMDEGRAYSGAFASGNRQSPSRATSMTGLVLRALDGRPDMWPGLRRLCDNGEVGALQYPYINDVREEAYMVSRMAFCALLDPDASLRQSYAEALVPVVDKWEFQQQPNGNFVALSSVLSAGTATVTNGSTTVTFSGTTVNAASFGGVSGPGYAWNFWTCSPLSPDCVSWNPRSDTVDYTVVSIDSTTQITISPAYQGITESGKYWMSAALNGFGTQPFMLGVATSAWDLARLALEKAPSPIVDARPAQFVIDMANWLMDYGYRPVTEGLWYGRQFPNCEPPSESNANCTQATEVESRALNGEAYHAISLSRLTEICTTDSTLSKFGDVFFGACFSKPGQVGPDGGDGVYCSELDVGQSWYVNPKFFGFFFGWGQASSWDKARYSTP